MSGRSVIHTCVRDLASEYSLEGRIEPPVCSLWWFERMSVESVRSSCWNSGLDRSTDSSCGNECVPGQFGHLLFWADVIVRVHEFAFIFVLLAFPVFGQHCVLAG